MIERRSWLVAAAESESVKIIRFNLLDLPKIGSAAATTTGDIFRVEVSKRVLYGAMFNKYMFFFLLLFSFIENYSRDIKMITIFI